MGGPGSSHRATLSVRAAFSGHDRHFAVPHNHAQWRRAFAARCGAVKSRRAPARGSAALLPTHPPSAAPRAPAKRARGPARPADCPPRHGGNLWLAAPKGSGGNNAARMTAGANSRRHAPWHPAQGPWRPPGRGRRGEFMHNYREPGRPAPRGAELLVRVRRDWPQNSSQNNSFFIQSWSQSIAGALRPCSAVICRRDGGIGDPEGPRAHFGPS